MASGPPASAAESSKISEKTSNIPSNSGGPHISTSTNPYQTQNPYASLANGQHSYHNYWQNAWSLNSLYTGGASTVPPVPHYSQSAYAPYQAHYYTMPVQPAAPTTISTPVPTSASSANDPSAFIAITAPQAIPAVKMEIDEDPLPPPPPLPNYEHWDEAVRVFLKDAGLIQALKGFECDMIVMNSQWERTRVPVALENLVKGLSTTCEYQSSKEKEREVLSTSSAEVQDPAGPEVDRSLEERKLDYIHLSTGEKARTPTSINKEISAFLARNRARNDASNRSEFLLSLSEKRKRFQESGDSPEDDTISCARTDARTINREAQMKYDIARNDDGPLRRTKAKKDDGRQPERQEEANSGRVQGPIAAPSDEEALPRHHPGIDERLTNIETHLAIRYVPSPPRTLWARLKFIEDHIIRLEKDYPPWAALHFNQPNRGWPPPPRATPIIVPPHLRSSDVDTHKVNAIGSQAGQQGSAFAPPAPVAGGSRPRNTKSSLQRAVMEKLEVKQAMGESADPGA